MTSKQKNIVWAGFAGIVAISAAGVLYVTAFPSSVHEADRMVSAGFDFVKESTDTVQATTQIANESPAPQSGAKQTIRDIKDAVGLPSGLTGRDKDIADKKAQGPAEPTVQVAAKP